MNDIYFLTFKRNIKDTFYIDMAVVSGLASSPIYSGHPNQFECI